jgi:hypothetical protein
LEEENASIQERRIARNVYDILNPHFNNNLIHTYHNLQKGDINILFKILLLIVSETGIVEKIFKIIYLNIKIIKYDNEEIEEMYNELKGKKQQQMRGNVQKRDSAILLFIDIINSHQLEF